MVKFYQNGFSYDYTWHAVTLAYFLRYPNPYSTHVISSDVISRHVDEAGILHTVRIHHKRGKLPAALTRLLPTVSDSYILETSRVNPHTMVMETETRNLDHTSILSVVEHQVYTPAAEGSGTNVQTTVRFDSRFGGRRQQSQQVVEGEAQEAQPQPEKRRLFNFGFGWGKEGVQRSIESLGARRMTEHVGSSTKGMQLVLTRLRNIGLIGTRGVERVNEDWKSVWRRVREEIPKADGVDAGMGV
ncbi:hypothetical protein TWF106_002660 [Orbilia oligospora]|uniref:PRELI/MSF1 domain-containing protein n=1 Tax=Orbilia oligospora TaxID=2813651 RepID=A0A6G1M2R9_ORBOL|nr:hypothetical protein TWF788_005369 [Orbilia oligospora]KAF3201938.1 hypothetical protein TWF106_002660 [Orbilia oligospora]KAF3221447.1 hypothetical protein TWF679_008134 [Orbilia oligospora]KAF3232370.1 hypothetical protein TWF191_000141 [Orbilia oligospora]KAF3242380.1 hypothetical protein TWF192_008635 [Orbilia oligospora]